MPDKRVTELAAIDAVVGTDLVMVIDDPGGTAVSKKSTVTQLLTNVARTDVSNSFAGDQTVDGDLFVTGEINPVVFAAQKAKIDLFTGTPIGDPSGSRTVMSRNLISGLSIRHDENQGHGRVAVGNYDTQIYQPVLFEVESFQVHTGVSPGDRVERLRVHPTGGVTVGAVHDIDPGDGVMQADSLGSTPLNADNLISGTVPNARLPVRLGTIGIVLDGAGAVITTGVKGFFEVGAACLITAVTLLSTDPAATVGSIVIDIWKASFVNYPPTAGNTITASARPTLASANKSRDTSLAGWATAIAAGDILAFNVVSASLVTKVSLTLTVQL